MFTVLELETSIFFKKYLLVYRSIFGRPAFLQIWFTGIIDHRGHQAAFMRVRWQRLKALPGLPIDDYGMEAPFYLLNHHISRNFITRKGR